MHKQAALCLTSLALTGCVGWPWNWGVQHTSARDYCKQALEQGWCSSYCKVQPTHCGELELVSCNSAGMCMYRAKDGSLVFTGKRQ